MDQLKGSTGESLSTQQQQPQPQQQQQQQSKKKSKNKKKSSRTETTAAAATTTTLPTVAVKDAVGVSADSCDVQVGPELAVNGLTDQLKQQLQMHDEGSSSNMTKANGLVTEKHLKTSAACPNTSTTTDCLPQTSSAKVVMPTPAINGHHPDEQRSATAQAAIKKSKRKPNNKKNPPPHTDHLAATNENGHCPAQATTIVTQPQLRAVVDDKEHLLHNGYNHNETQQEDNNQTALGQTNNTASSAKSQINSQEITNKTAMAPECPAKEQIATKPQQEEKDSNKSIVAAEDTPVENPTLDLEHAHIEYKEYESELQMHDIMRLIQAELSEPYSIYTYRYFIYNWPKLCFLAAHGNEYVGAIVCKLDMHMNVRRGYIAMLAVRKEYRKLKIGTTLVQKAIEAMLADKADEVVLETEMSNLPALRLYENLGFVRDKRLFRYYLNGVDALRLKLWFR